MSAPDFWIAWIVTGAWQGLAVAAVVLLVVSAGRRWPARLREGLLSTAALKFLLPPFLTAPTAALAWAASLAPAAAATSSGLLATAASADAGPWTGVLFVVWAAGVMVVASAAVRGVRQVNALRRAAALPSASLFNQASLVAQRLGLRRMPALLISDRASAPIAVGVWRPAVVLPARMVAALTPEELDGVLAHELSHHRRRHLAWGWLRVAACGVWWWHPAVWVVARQLRRVHEEVCDDDVVHAKVMEPERYCEVLVRAAASSQPWFAAGAPFADRRHPVGARILRLLDSPAPRRGRPWRNSAVVLIVAMLLLPGRLPYAEAPVASAAPWPAELPVVTVVAGIGEMIDVHIESVLSVLALADGPSDPAAARPTRARAADAAAGKVRDTLLASGAPEQVAFNVSREISRSIRNENRRLWRDLGRGFGRLFR